ncbi:MAG: TetR/AcrR family transcriptional regulator [Proteobacteria bacterium]|nr:TetR/AcrR family transcriptional regulator [Pseudomonadota bacterium]
MARVRSQDYDVIKQSIIDCAANLFATNGFAGTSINELAEAAGLSKAGVYHYFDSKSEILRAMLTAHLEAVTEIVDTALNTSEPPRAKFITFTRLMIENYTRPASRNQHIVLMSDIGSLPAKDRDFVIATERRVVRAIERLLQSIHPQIEAHQHLARPLTMLFFGMINWTDNWYSEKGRMSPSELALLAANVFLNGLEHTDYSAINTQG